MITGQITSDLISGKNPSEIQIFLHLFMLTEKEKKKKYSPGTIYHQELVENSYWKKKKELLKVKKQETVVSVHAVSVVSVRN